MLTNIQIEELAAKMGIPLEGVYFKNELPPLKYNRSYILNMEDELDEDGKPNIGSHWVALQIHKSADGKVSPIYFDSFGVGAPKAVSEAVFKFCGKKLPHCAKDIQSLVSSMCGWYCLAFLHWINSSKCQSGHFYTDVDRWLDLYCDLSVETDHLKNEWMLKQFFRSNDPALRVPIDAF